MAPKCKPDSSDPKEKDAAKKRKAMEVKVDIPEVLLILDNAPGHPAHLDKCTPNIKVLYFPPNTTSLIQPTDQGVISTFKAYYLRRVINNALAATEKNND
ncbi:tigger transposable element-derived protein 1 [Biomphalaria pfeifferi]|uniref:Tigger transposable element-derived protein 1 n=1 Tax=Biomphalaria pfeifferi TaxID=112525 RepID=A0AAD8BLN3_BIOPF|nr:tigger transposable element-derived protein 1 [Biomphalaria pfeifferi]